MKIYKYPLELKEKQYIDIALVRALDVQIQNGIPCLWAIVDNNESKMPKKRYKISLVGTGHDIKRDIVCASYIATTQTGNFVWHWFIANAPAETNSGEDEREGDYEN